MAKINIPLMIAKSLPESWIIEEEIKKQKKQKDHRPSIKLPKEKHVPPEKQKQEKGKKTAVVINI